MAFVTNLPPEQPAPQAAKKKCIRCGHWLKKPKWRELGYGPTCLQWVRYQRVMDEAKANGWSNNPS
jgi:hypothetical protein